jgi:hypothetical protein
MPWIQRSRALALVAGVAIGAPLAGSLIPAQAQDQQERSDRPTTEQLFQKAAYAEATLRADDALRLYEKVYESDPTGEFGVLAGIRIAAIHRQHGHIDRAAGTLERVDHTLKENGIKPPPHVLKALAQERAALHPRRIATAIVRPPLPDGTRARPEVPARPEAPRVRVRVDRTERVAGDQERRKMLEHARELREKSKALRERALHAKENNWTEEEGLKDDIRVVIEKSLHQAERLEDEANGLERKIMEQVRHRTRELFEDREEEHREMLDHARKALRQAFSDDEAEEHMHDLERQVEEELHHLKIKLRALEPALREGAPHELRQRVFRILEDENGMRWFFNDEDEERHERGFERGERDFRRDRERKERFLKEREHNRRRGELEERLEEAKRVFTLERLPRPELERRLQGLRERLEREMDRERDHREDEDGHEMEEAFEELEERLGHMEEELEERFEDLERGIEERLGDMEESFAERSEHLEEIIHALREQLERIKERD